MIQVEVRVPLGTTPLLADEVTCVDAFSMRTIRKGAKIQGANVNGEKIFRYISDWDETSIKVFWKWLMGESPRLILIIRECGVLQ